MQNTWTKHLLIISLSTMMLGGCATQSLLNKRDSIQVRTKSVEVINDQVVAFGKPVQSVESVPNATIVIAGKKYSYLLTQGGERFAKLLATLDPKRIQISDSFRFYSANNDGRFTGSLPLAYVMLEEDVTKKDLSFFIENMASECTTGSDKRMKSQRFCFNIKLDGIVFPVVKNIDMLKPLSRAYQVSIYTEEPEKYIQKASLNPVEKLVLLPFAVAIDIIALPFKAADKILD